MEPQTVDPQAIAAWIGVFIALATLVERSWRAYEAIRRFFPRWQKKGQRHPAQR